MKHYNLHAIGHPFKAMLTDRARNHPSSIGIYEALKI